MNKKTSGFTVIELLAAVAIVGVLVALAIPAYKQYQAKAKTAEAKAGLAAVYTAEKSFYQQASSYTALVGKITERTGTGYYSVGFDSNSAAASSSNKTCGPTGNNTQSCLQLCFDPPNSTPHCSVAGAGMTFAAGPGITFIQNQMGKTVDLTNTSTFSQSKLTGSTFIAIAAANESDILGSAQGLISTAYADGTCSYDEWAIDNNKNLYSLGCQASSP